MFSFVFDADGKLAVLLLYTAASDGLKKMMKAGNGLDLDRTDCKYISFIPLQNERDSQNLHTVVVSQTPIADSYLFRSYSLYIGDFGLHSVTRDHLTLTVITRKTASSTPLF
jgi:hypothetical protein